MAVSSFLIPFRATPMSSEGSVTRWIDRLQAGDEEAARKLWDRYFHQLVGLARKKLKSSPFRSVEEDVALTAFDSFCRGARHGRFPDLADRDNLWGLLITITSRKACDWIEHEMRQKRYAGPTDSDIGQLLDREPDPAFALQVADEFQRLLDRLGDPVLQSIALWRMEGYTSKEIAARLSQVRRAGERTVERKLDLIRKTWQQETPP
jgi:DNA-directed RNA polymerase specialized sigma24 family protein